jgi:hypothetical protein
VGKGDLAWLTNNSDSDLNYESEVLSTYSDSDADNSVRGSNAGAKGRVAHGNEDDLRATRQNRQQGPSEGLPVPSTISRKETLAADSIDLQILAEKPNELALAGQDNEREHRRRSPRRRLGIRRSSSTSPIAGTNNPPPPPPPPPPDIPRSPFDSLYRPPRPPPPPGIHRHPRPPTESIHPQNSLMEKILPSSTLQSLFVQNWNNPRVSEPYIWRDRLRVTGRRKSESSLDNHRQEEGNSPSVYRNLPPDMSKRTILAGWRRRAPGADMTKGPIPAHEHIPNQFFPDLTTELGRAAERSFGLDLYDDNPQSLFISYLLDTIEFIRYERNFMESLDTTNRSAGTAAPTARAKPKGPRPPREKRSPSTGSASSPLYCSIPWPCQRSYL